MVHMKGPEDGNSGSGAGSSHSVVGPLMVIGPAGVAAVGGSSELGEPMGDGSEPLSFPKKLCSQFVLQRSSLKTCP